MNKKNKKNKKNNNYTKKKTLKKKTKKKGKGLLSTKRKKTKKVKFITKSLTSYAKSPSVSNITSNTIIIKDKSTLVDKNISKSYKKLLSLKDKNIDKLQTIQKDLTQNKSFSPEINKRLQLVFKDINYQNIFGCGLNTPLVNKKFRANVTRRESSLFKSDLNVNIGTIKKPICVDRDDPRAQEFLINNIENGVNISCRDIISPLQIRANCWFNTMLMCFFVSDKGKKFFKFFRQLMVTGKLANGDKIQPQPLADSFFLFNAAIDACYNSNNDRQAANLALAMDTNNIITRIYNSMPKNRKGPNILDVDEPNNPLYYYTDIMNYLNSDKINIGIIDYRQIKMFESKTNNQIPDVYAISLSDNDSKQINNKKTTITLHGVDYVLDSVIVRDTQQYHFSAVLACGKEQLGFDGASMSRLNTFDWKQYINKDVDWTFEGSNFNDDKKDPILWNFRQGYQIMFYYRK